MITSLHDYFQIMNIIVRDTGSCIFKSFDALSLIKCYLNVDKLETLEWISTKGTA